MTRLSLMLLLVLLAGVSVLVLLMWPTAARAEVSVLTVAAPRVTGTQTPTLPLGWTCDPSGGPACFQDLNKLVMISENEGWAVGNGGVILHYDNGNWDRIASPTTNDLYGLDMLSATEGWAVGKAGTILHYRDGSWLTENYPNSNKPDLYGVDLLSSTTGWIVGDYVILHRTNNQWAEQSTFQFSNLRDVQMTSATEGWAVGGAGQAQVVHYISGTWQTVNISTTPNLYALSMISATEGWAVGYNETVFHYQGGVWQKQIVTMTPYINLYAVRMISATEGWAAGGTMNKDRGGVVLHYINGMWRQILTTANNNFYSIDVNAAGKGWAIGPAGTIYHLDNGVAQAAINPGSQREFGNLQTTSIGGGWAVGTWGQYRRVSDTWKLQPTFIGGRAIGKVSADDVWFASGTSVAHYQNSSLTLSAVGQLYFDDIAMVSANEGWGVGGGFISHYHDGYWEVVGSTTKWLYSISMISANDGWAVGNSGVIMHYSGGAWQEVASPTTTFLYSIDMISANEGWAVGNNVVLHYTGGNWQIVSAPAGLLTRISMSSASDGWAVGDVILHYNGTSWASVTNPATHTLYAVSMISSTEGWAAGAYNTLLHYSNGAWQIVNSPSVGSYAAAGFNDLLMLSPTDGWLIGDDGLAHYQNGAWRIVTNPYAINKVSLLNEAEGWGLGSGLLHLADDVWQRTNLFSEFGVNSLLDLDTVSAGDSWAVGSDGAILHRVGANWQLATSPTTGTLMGIDMLNATDGWAVGYDANGGLILHYSGSNWQVATAPITNVYRLTAVDMVSPTLGWALGAYTSSVILRYDGNNWQTEATFPGITLNGLSMASDKSGWAVGWNSTNGVIVQYANGAWTVVAPVTHQALNVVSAVSTDEAWAAGYGGVLLHYRTPGLGQISGRVIATDSLPLAHISVNAYISNTYWSYARSVDTDANGYYTMTGLMSGTYRLHFVDPSGFHLPKYHTDAISLNAADDVVLATNVSTATVTTTLALRSITPAATATANTGSFTIDPYTGQLTIVMGRSHLSDITFSTIVTCTGSLTPTGVTLRMGDHTPYAMTETPPGSHTYQVTVLASAIVFGTINVEWLCNSTPFMKVIGWVALFDPSGQITDAVTGQPIVGANVSLYKAPGWRPRTSLIDIEPGTCETNLSRPTGVPWSQSAPTDIGVWANPEIGALSGTPEISPTINPQTTGKDGRYAWDVAAGCWYVVVQAEGYQSRVSPLVGVPTAVTDLDLTLQPLMSQRKVYLPLIRK